MDDLKKLEALLERGNGSVAFFRREGKVHCVVKYLGAMKKPKQEYFGEGETLEEAIRNTYKRPKDAAPITLPPGLDITHQKPKTEHRLPPGLTTR